MKVTKQILQYLLGFYLLFMSLGYLIIGNKSLIGALVSAICAILIIPITRKLIEEKLNFKINNVVKYSIPFIGFFAPFFFIDYDKIANDKNVKNQIVVDSIIFRTDSTELKDLKNKPRTNIILPNATIPAVKNNISESKILSTKKQKKHTFESKYTTTNRKKQNQLNTKKTQTYQSSSGLCGHKNKTGGYCKRRVKGGGYCWQHS